MERKEDATLEIRPIDEPSNSSKHDASSSDETVAKGPSERSAKAGGYLKSIQRYLWDDPDKPKHEKWFLFKLDCFLLSAACLGYFSKNMDQANISNAYVSGMKEALSMQGSELTYATNTFAAGYIVGQMPAVMLATKVRPSILIPVIEIVWSILTFCNSIVKTVPQLYALRFLVGLFESGYFPVMIYLIGSWYTKAERGKRIALFYCTAQLAQMFSGYIQAGAYSGLDGVMGRAGWQWLFIICGIISLPIAFLGFAFIPDFPETTRCFYITEEEAARQCERLKQEGQKPLGSNPWNRKKICRIAKHWQFWILPLGYFCMQAAYPNDQPALALWLTSRGNSVYQRNVWPTGQVAVGVVVQVSAGILSDSPLLKGQRWPAIILMQAVTLLACILLRIWNIPDALKFVAYYLSWFCAGAPGPYYAWYSDLIPHDHEMRGFVIAASNMFSYINRIWYSIAFWRTAAAPRFEAGFTAASVMGVAIMGLVGVMWGLQRRNEKRDGRLDGERQEREGESEVV